MCTDNVGVWIVFHVQQILSSILKKFDDPEFFNFSNLPVYIFKLALLRII